MGQWLTPDIDELTSTERDCRVISVNPALWYLVNGALLELSRVWKWQQFGSATPDECTRFFYELWESFYMSSCAYIGELRSFTAATLPDKWLAMNGSSVVAADYPELAAIVPGSWLVGGNIVLPDLRARALVGSGSGYALGSTGGAETHTLTTSEMPAHTHSYQAPVIATDILGEIPAPAVNAEIPAVTGSAGGGQAHNNMPPYLAVNWGIYAGR